MRQTLLLNLVVLGFFVFLFLSIYRKRRSSQLRMWIAAYLFAMAHFAIGLWRPASPALEQVAGAAGFTALLLCGLCFLLSHPALDAGHERRTVAITVGGGALALGVAAAFQSTPNPLFLAVELLFELAGAWFLWRLNAGRPWLLVPLLGAMAACCAWSGYALYREPDAVAAALLMELFGLCALMFADAFRRRSAGAWTTILGFVAWAAVFPAGVLVMAHAPHAVVDPEIWNVPKVVVAFGILVLLFEDEVAIARRDREQYRHIFDNNPTPMWLFNKDSMQLLEANGAAVRTFGWRHADLPTLTINDLLAPADRAAGELLELNRRLGTDGRGEFPSAALNGEVRAATARFQTRRGEELIVEATLQRAKFLGEEARLLMAKDVTAQVHVHEQLVHQANHDPLTGLPNRLLLQDRLQAALASAVRHNAYAAVLCLDLDRFKHINDTYGHAAGDSCLREVAGRLQSRLRAVDTAARVGGEEFMVVLNDVRSLADAEGVARQLLSSLRAPHRVEGASIELSASIGVAIYPGDGEEAAELWHNADAAMYRAKQSGGNRHSLFSLAD